MEFHCIWKPLHFHKIPRELQPQVRDQLEEEGVSIGGKEAHFRCFHSR